MCIRDREEVVEVDAVFVENAVAPGRFMERDATLRSQFIGSVDVLHVGAHLDEIHFSVSIKGDGHGLLDRWLAQDEL